MTTREAVHPTDKGRHALYGADSYSPAIRSGDLLFVSGQVGSRPDGSPKRVTAVALPGPTPRSGT